MNTYLINITSILVDFLNSTIMEPFIGIIACILIVRLVVYMINIFTGRRIKING